MKTRILIVIALSLFQISNGQIARVIMVKHELRWTDETRFPNYFLYPDLRDSIFSDTRQELLNKLQSGEVVFPEKVEYKIINGFGNQKVEMPAATSTEGPEIGIFSFITRATSGFAMHWKMSLIVREKGKTIISSEVSHELEYFDASGYLSSRCWLSPEEFRAIFGRLVKEALGSLPASDEKITLGLPEEKEELIRTLFPDSERALLKIKGAWLDAGNFTALLESERDTLAMLDYRSGWDSEYVVPTGSGIFANLFTEITGIDTYYEQKVILEKKGTMLFPDGKRTKIRLRWIEMQERTVSGEGGISTVTEPLITELYDGETRAGDFLYTRRVKVHGTDQTTESFNIFSGFQTVNTLGSERTQQIDGFLGDIPVYAEFNEYFGIIEVSADTVLLAMMVAQNCNPDSQSFGKAKMSKNKKIMVSGSSIGRQSMDDTQKVEWYPIYLPVNASKETGEMCIKILSCLFFGMGTQGQPTIYPE
ncbi:MAG: hypothetical protein IH594_14705 [Bacteroidales bacterium]|nr:hypothetical protein [Bacteroidales bacterium]